MLITYKGCKDIKILLLIIFFIAHQPLVGQGLIIENSRSELRHKKLGRIPLDG
jgi:hypothetical protein